MNLYAIHQPDSGGVDFGMEYWDFIWADTTEDAVEFYVRRWKGECDPRATDEEFKSGLHWEIKDTSRLNELTGEKMPFIIPELPGCHAEHRLKTLRDIGCMCEGETMCESCGLYAMGIDEYEVCPECNNCKECGHEDDCDCAFSPHGGESSMLGPRLDTAEPLGDEAPRDSDDM